MKGSIAIRSLGLPGADLTLRECGSGPAVVMIPSWIRPASDFDHLLAELARAGYHGIARNLRGIDGSTGSYAGGTLRTMAADVAAVIEGVGIAPVHVIGHALGNVIARCVATDYPSLVKSVILLAAGGRIAGPPAAWSAFFRTIREDLTDAEWLRLMRESGFFAHRFDPMQWRHDWWTGVADEHQAAVLAVPSEHWWTAGRAPLLVVQGLEDRIAVPENGWALKREVGDRATLLDLQDAAHALLPERPKAIATAVISFLGSQR